jgi:hypothetical protein
MSGPDFDGGTYERERDQERLRAQLTRVLDLMRGGTWFSLAQIAALTGHPEASVSARLRDLRKVKFGAWVVERRYAGDGLWQYHVAPTGSPPAPLPEAKVTPRREMPSLGRPATPSRPEWECAICHHEMAVTVSALTPDMGTGKCIYCKSKVQTVVRNKP